MSVGMPEQRSHTGGDCWCGKRHYVPKPPKSRPYDYSRKAGRRRKR